MRTSELKKDIMESNVGKEGKYFQSHRLFCPYIGDEFANGKLPRILVVGDFFDRKELFDYDFPDIKPIDPNFPESSYSSYTMQSDKSPCKKIQDRIFKSISEILPETSFDARSYKEIQNKISFYYFVHDACRSKEGFSIRCKGSDLDLYLLALAKVIDILRPKFIIIYGNQTLRRISRKVRPIGFGGRSLEEFLRERDIELKTAALLNGVSDKTVNTSHSKCGKITVDIKWLESIQKSLENIDAKYLEIAQKAAYETIKEPVAIIGESPSLSYKSFREDSVTEDDHPIGTFTKTIGDIIAKISEQIEVASDKTKDTPNTDKQQDNQIQCVKILTKYLIKEKLVLSFNLVASALKSLNTLLDKYPELNETDISLKTKLLLDVKFKHKEVKPEEAKQIQEFIYPERDSNGRGVHKVLKHVYDILKISLNTEDRQVAEGMRRSFVKIPFEQAVEWSPSFGTMFWDPEKR